MKKNDLSATRAKDKNGLMKLVIAKRQELNVLAVKAHTKGDKNLKKVKNLRRELAQLLTLLREREIVDEEKSKIKTVEKESASVK